MSLTTMVTAHCDACGHWVYTADHPARVRRRRGWISVQRQARRIDLCPDCAKRSNYTETEE